MLIKNNRLLKQSNFKLEKDIQSFVEKHIPDILGEEYEFVCTEFSVVNFRIDTLAFNKETKSFILIENKKVENKSLVDQGLTYLKLLKDRRADFILKYNEIKKTNYNINYIDISQSKVIFFSPYYNKYVKIPWFIILYRNVCNNNKILYGIIILLSHKEGYCLLCW